MEYRYSTGEWRVGPPKTKHGFREIPLTKANREMLLEVDEQKRFFNSIGSFMAYLGTDSSYLCLFEHPLRVRQGTIPDFPEKIYVGCDGVQKGLTDQYGAAAKVNCWPN